MASTQTRTITIRVTFGKSDGSTYTLSMQNADEEMSLNKIKSDLLPVAAPVLGVDSVVDANIVITERIPLT